MTTGHIRSSNVLLPELRIHRGTIGEAKAHHFHISTKSKKVLSKSYYTQEQTAKRCKEHSCPLKSSSEASLHSGHSLVSTNCRLCVG